MHDFMKIAHAGFIGQGKPKNGGDMKETVKEVLMRNLKSEGLDIAEDTAKALTKAVFKTLKEVAAATANPIDDAVVAILGQFEDKLIELEDKIDGEQG